MLKKGGSYKPESRMWRAKERQRERETERERERGV